MHTQSGMPACNDLGVFAVGAEALPPESVVFGKSEAMQAVRMRFDRVTAANIPVLIRGESGTGKEIVARLLHHNSPWSNGPFVKVHCPAIPGTLMESELFGYERGAFTGANGSKLGRVELAHRGTLFLDEIAELDPSLQAKLLQLLQDGQFCRVGSTEDKRIEVRVLCATNRNLEQDIRDGSFRQDLFYRINVVNIQLPPLRARRQDIPLLVKYFLDSYSEQFGCPVSPLSQRALRQLQDYDWPGNIRELGNLIKRFVVLGNEETITADLVNLSGNMDANIPDGFGLKRLTRNAVLDLERRIILNVLQRNNWNRKEAARALKISYRALLYKIKEAGLPSKRMPLARAAEGQD